MDVRARAASSTFFAASSRKRPICSAKNPASSSPSTVFVAQPLLAVRFLSRLSCGRRLHLSQLSRHRRCIPCQRQLRAGRRVLLFHPRSGPETILFTDLRHAFGSFPSVLLRRIPVLRVPLFILLCQPRKLLAHKRPQLLCRGR